MAEAEGYIKFNCIWKEADSEIPVEVLAALNSSREILFKKNLIGAYPSGIGFGNISFRDPEQNTGFFISGSATGHLPHLMSDHYARVTGFELGSNKVFCTGRTRASSETLSHAAVYELCLAVQAVVHIHHLELWKALLRTFPVTSPEVTYGTPEMAWEIQRLIREKGLYSGGLMVMAGHEEGILSYGLSPVEASSRILHELEKL